MLLALSAMFAAGQSFSCQVVAVHDGDTMRCADGTRARLQGIDANELDGSCHTVCAALSADLSRQSLESLALNQVALCHSTGRSYDRVTAWCDVTNAAGVNNDLSCEQVARKAAIIWRKFDPDHRLDRCQREPIPRGSR